MRASLHWLAAKPDLPDSLFTQQASPEPFESNTVGPGQLSGVFSEDLSCFYNSASKERLTHEDSHYSGKKSPQWTLFNAKVTFSRHAVFVYAFLVVSEQKLKV